jgi:hypothetical protein
LPAGWEQAVDGSGRVYWFHKETRQSRWTRPEDGVAAKIEARLASERSATAERQEKRKAELAAKASTAATEAAESEAARRNTQARLKAWAPKYKKIHELLRTLHELLPRSVLQAPLQIADGSAGAKRGYREAVKVVHPDRLSGSLSVAERQLCEGAFSVLTDAFNLFRASD